MPRPRTHSQAARTRAITVRVTDEARARLTAEAAQLGMSLAGLAERYLTKGTIKIEASDAPAPLHPALIAELKRLITALHQASNLPEGTLPASGDQIVGNLRDLLQLLLKDELLSQRINSLRTRNIANDTAPPSSRDQFQRVVHVRPARS